MARPRSEGLQYFSLDCKFDEKINALMMLHGNDGLAFIIRAWQEAYQNYEGIYDLSGIRLDIGAKTIRISSDNFREILDNCLKLQILYEIEPKGCSKYTSNGIQKRIKRVIGEREYDRIYAKNKLSERKCTDNVPIMPQMEMEIKVNKTKEKKEKIYPPEFIECSELLKKRVLERKQIVLTSAQFNSWHDQVRLMVDRDARTTEEIKAMISECHDMPPNSTTGFTWANNILSMATLREKWNEGKIAIGMNNKTPENTWIYTMPELTQEQLNTWTNGDIRNYNTQREETKHR